MMTLLPVSRPQGVRLMRRWGLPDWVDPGAQYVAYGDFCVFAVVQQPGFLDVHIAMEADHRHKCRTAGQALLEVIGKHRLRALIPTDKTFARNFLTRMNFTGWSLEEVRLIDGSTTPAFVMWREPGR